MEGGSQPPAAAEMEGEILQPVAETEGETLPPPAEVGDETQPPAAEVGGETRQPPPFPACVSKVLDDENLLPEIIVRVGSPTSLVRAAAVCRRWFGLASDRAFLRCFRELHSPRRLLGFYLVQRPSEHPDAAVRFFPTLPQPPPPDLAAVVRRASFSLDFYKGQRTDILGCSNGRVVTRLPLQKHRNRREIAFVVHNPLCSERGMIALPTLHFEFQEDSRCRFGQLFSREEGDVVSYFYCVIMVEPTAEAKSMAHVFVLRNGDDSWRTHLTLPVDDLLYTRSDPSAVLVGNKIYMASSRPQLVVLDLMASSFSTIQLPLGVDFHTRGTTMLSRGDDASSVYLINAKRLQLHIWLHKGGNWLLVDKICLRETCPRLLEDEPITSFRINHAGDYTAEFLFLELGRFALYLDVKCRMLRKVCDTTGEDFEFGRIYPFMSIWPPIFPALKDVPTSNAT
ncbi:unnamed protein product [Alopecurus aequalis]